MHMEVWFNIYYKEDGGPWRGYYEFKPFVSREKAERYINNRSPYKTYVDTVNVTVELPDGMDPYPFVSS